MTDLTDLTDLPDWHTVHPDMSRQVHLGTMGIDRGSIMANIDKTWPIVPCGAANLINNLS